MASSGLAFHLDTSARSGAKKKVGNVMKRRASIAKLVQLSAQDDSENQNQIQKPQRRLSLVDKLMEVKEQKDKQDSQPSELSQQHLSWTTKSRPFIKAMNVEDWQASERPLTFTQDLSIGMYD